MRHQRFGSSAEEQREFIQQCTGFVGQFGFSQTLIAGVVLPVDKVYSGAFHALRKAHGKRLVCAGKTTERFFDMHMQRIAYNFARGRISICSCVYDTLLSGLCRRSSCFPEILILLSRRLLKHPPPLLLLLRCRARCPEFYAQIPV